MEVAKNTLNIDLQQCTLRIGSHEYASASDVLQAFLESYATKSSLVLDAGCGSSPWHLVRLDAAHGVALDVDRENARKAMTELKERQKLNLSVVVGDIENLPFRKEMFEVVISCDVLEHVGKPEKAIQELAFSVKKGGKLLVTTSNLLNPLVFVDEVLPGSISDRTLQSCACAYAQVTAAHLRAHAYYERHHHLTVRDMARTLKNSCLALEKLLMFAAPPFGYVYKYKRHPIESHRVLCCSWIVFDRVTNLRFLRMFKEEMLVVAQKK